MDTETCFVNGDREVTTGNAGTFGTDWMKSTWIEARRIADGLGGSVAEEQPNSVPFEYGGRNYVQKNELVLAVLVDNRVVARVRTSTTTQV